jgi:hypothetical protein
MIWFRRTLTIPLIVVFVILFIAVLLITQVNSTVGNPKFYNDQLRRVDIYNFVYDEVLPAALDDIETDDSSDIPIGLAAIDDEIIAAVREILPPEWLQAQVESAANEIIPYLLGDTEHFTYILVLKDRVEAAADVIKADIIHGTAFDSIYDDGISYLADELSSELPEMTKEELEDELRSLLPQDWVVWQLESAIDAVVPYMTGDSSHFTITIDLEPGYIGDLVLELLGVGEALTFTDADLVNSLDSEGQQILEDVRHWIASGYTVTETDLREAISPTDPELESFDDVRHWVGTGRTWLWTLWLIPVILLIAIGFLGGRSWRGRLAWALAGLFIGSLVAYVAMAVTYSSVGEPQIQELMLNPSQYEGVMAVVAEKGNELIENAFDSFASSVTSKALYVMIGSAVALGGVIGWSVVSQRRKLGKPPE